MAKHTHGDLEQMQSLPLESKITMTQRRIQDWYDHWNGDVYVSFSGGKDSTVLKHIVDGMYDDVPSVFVNTGLEFPELQSFVRDIKAGKYDCFNSNVEILTPEKRFDEVLKEYGYPVISKVVAHNVSVARRNPNGNVAKNIMFNPDRTGLFNHYKWNFLINEPFLVSEKCCDVMKKKPARQYAKETGRKVILGTMAHESKLRYSNWLKNGCNAFDGSSPSSQPMAFWTEQDVLQYLKTYDVPFSKAYGEIRQKPGSDLLELTGYQRTGCVYCLFGAHREALPNRIQRLKETHPKQYAYCINGGEYVDGMWQPNKDGLGLKLVLERLNIPYE